MCKIILSCITFINCNPAENLSVVHNDVQCSCLTFLPSGGAGMKLDAKVMTVASASVLFHRFFREVNTTDYDVYVSFV